MSLDPSRVPPPVRSLLPLAERWGIADDGFRQEALEGASSEELSEILQKVGSCEPELNAWLCGEVILEGSIGRVCCLLCAANGSGLGKRRTWMRWLETVLPVVPLSVDDGQASLPIFNDA